ncbi:hypothetical protein M2352_000790 [Azospirillum fermentarium]|uniref:DUF5666 domain-containing protein n=1 Tax=Azospirillum fermentarium TaxID=1233114 RepID=UPI002227C598|nr:DUF5666 domain-containing protein [Azospirillum fermentarium]MCW2245199.1 hypothetical protein [Azospirillum fermentarium]
MNRRLLSALLTTALLAGCGTDAPVRSGDRGIGGTGSIAERGIGGTGTIADRGIGGTGIVGTVTAFGSIWVNGHRVALPPSAAVQVEGHPAGIGAVRVGHVVAVDAGAAADGADATARAVAVRYAAAGPVEAVESGGLTVLGQRVDLTGAVMAALPQPGAWVAVSGLRRPDGGIAAGLVEPWDPARGWLLRGTAVAGAPGELTLPGFRARLAPGLTAPEAGQPVRAAGRFGPGGAVAAEAAPDPLNPFGATVNALSVEVYVDAAGHPAGAGPALGIAADLPGRVVVEGTVDRAGALKPGRLAAAPGIGKTGAAGPPGAGPPGMGKGQAGARGRGAGGGHGKH